MKKIILTIITGLIILESTIAQEIPRRIIPNSSFERDRTTKPKINTSDYFLEKSAKKQITADRLAGIGGVLGISGLLLYQNRHYGHNQFGEYSLNEGGGIFLMISGTALIAISIPLFIESAHDKNKALAMTASLNLETLQDQDRWCAEKKYYPAVSLNLHW